MSAYLLTEGVQVHYLPTTQYKTIQIMVRFTSLLKKDTITKRTLLSSLLETNSLHYPNQLLLSEKLADLYGASFGVDINKKGNYHLLTLSVNLVNGNYLENQPAVFEEAVDFIHEILFFPYIEKNAFHSATFDREKENLLDYLASVNEDKQLYAALKLQEILFSESPAQKTPSFGTIEDLQKETASSIGAYYQEMLLKDQVDIFVIGDIVPENINKLLQKLKFQPRAPLLNEIFYPSKTGNVIFEKVEEQPIVQSKLNLGYHTNIYFYQKDYFPFLVFNGIFGGFPHSKLFTNVREKQSMAYYASSSIDTFRGVMTVQTGIDGKNREKVLRLVAEQLQAIQTGEITKDELQQTKAMLKNQYLLSMDNPNAQLEKKYVEVVYPDSKISLETWCKRIDEVSEKQVQDIAAQVQLAAVYFLEGGEA